MPIYRLTPLEPDAIARLTTAYEHTLKALSLIGRNDPITERIAKTNIEIGQTGIKDPSQIAMLAN